MNQGAPLTTRSLALVLALLLPVSASAAAPGGDDGKADPDAAASVAAVLDGFHEAASRADGKAYLGALAPDAVFIGTDATERWSVPEFRAFAEPYFARGTGWTYVPTSRHVVIGPGGAVAWFDEILENSSYGTCRGTGVLVRREGGWKIAQYHLTIPIPNALAKDVVARIRDAARPIAPAPNRNQQPDR